MLKELWFHRKLIMQNGIKDLYIRYAGSTFGAIWNLLNPIAQISIYTIVFSNIMLAKIPGLTSTSSYAIYLCSGLLPWLSFSETISRCSFSIVENSTILKKLPIPEDVFVVQNGISVLISLFISMFLLLALLIFLGFVPNNSWLLIPLIIILMELFALGIGLFFAGIYVFFKDMEQLIGILLQIWMWITPIVYVKDILPISFQNVLIWNPLYFYIEALHECIVFGRFPSIYSFYIMSGISALSVIGGNYILQQLKPEIRDVL